MKKFLYLDSLNKRNEAYGYEISDFINSFSPTPGRPIKTNGSGLIDTTLLPVVPAGALQITKKASETIAIGECVKADNDTHVSLATFDGTASEATVLGIAITAGGVGDDIIVFVMGITYLIDFAIFPVNSLLFLDVTGTISDERPAFPAANYLTTVGKSLGNGYIFVQIGIPNKLS